MDIIIVSGRSGSGKTSALHVLEDLGYYVMDNLPLPLIVQAVASVVGSGLDKIALGVDIRTPKGDLSEFTSVYDMLTLSHAGAVRVLYLTADTGVLVARFGEARRVHPLMQAGVGNLPSAIGKESELLDPVAQLADVQIDTSRLNIHELKDTIRDYVGAMGYITLNVLSFGFKYGVPSDADFVFDVRVLPNPHWQKELKTKTGQDVEVMDFFRQHPEVDEMAEDIAVFLNKHLPSFVANNRHLLTIAIGCTGGKHRSVYVADRIVEALDLPDEFCITTKHREKRYWDR